MVLGFKVRFSGHGFRDSGCHHQPTRQKYRPLDTPVLIDDAPPDVTRGGDVISTGPWTRRRLELHLIIHIGRAQYKLLDTLVLIEDTLVPIEDARLDVTMIFAQVRRCDAATVPAGGYGGRLKTHCMIRI